VRKKARKPKECLDSGIDQVSERNNIYIYIVEEEVNKQTLRQKTDTRI
jgi:hypothetical protein